MSQLIVDLSADGVTVSPVPFLDGSEDFAEVSFVDVFVPEDDLLGEPGEGWKQVVSELAFERAGPDRYLSTWQLFERFTRRRTADLDECATAAIGRLVARFWAIRQMSLSIAASIDAGASPATQAALVKDIGTAFEQEVVEVVRERVEMELSLDDEDGFGRLLALATLHAPSFTIRGGTSEVLRSLAAKGLAGHG